MEKQKSRSLPLILGLLIFSAPVIAHPMGNSSVNHYARISPGAQGVEIEYVLDLADMPTLELLRKWNLAASSSQGEIESRAAVEAREWIGNLSITSNGRSVEPHLESTAVTMAAGAGGMRVIRVTMRMRLPVAAGTLAYEDRNYAGRAGWKEIVIRAASGAAVEKATQSNQDRSQALTAYPPDATIAPPQDLRASLEWMAAGPHAPARAPEIVRQAAVTAGANSPSGAISAPAPTATSGPQPAAPGTVLRGDFLSQLLNKREIGLGMVLLGLAVAFSLGAIHALSPGHGKTIVAAYLVGARGTFKHAIFLGGMVTFTHTVSVFFLGFTTLFLSQYVLPEKIFPVLGAISGISIVWIGAMLLYKRAMGLRGEGHSHGDAHGHDHVHGPHGHSHVPEGDVTMGSLIALGASGGLVPCPSALVLLLSSVALGRVGLGMILLVSFSTGLAMVLMGIGVIVLYAKHLLPDSEHAARHPAFRLIPVFSAALIVCIGLVMTGVSLGVIRPDRLRGLI